ncbi:hypothetical protein AB6735_24160 [Mucilaginibacter sp. RCC_168]|uniref:hypothetical protein n=1 Tax=Mucilaginibacter sp. RCC_168 TaxID=3239221 RepID=UPI0035250ED5
MHSFPYDATIDGIEHHFRITQNHSSYGIEQDGVVIGEVAHFDNWQQTTGEPLSKKLLDSICEHIESHYG